MSNKQETGANISKEMRGITFGEECCPDCGADFQRSNRWIEFADRSEAAHQREVAELREFLGAALEVVDSTAEKLGVINSVKSCEEYKMWRKVLETTKGAEDEGK